MGPAVAARVAGSLTGLSKSRFSKVSDPVSLSFYAVGGSAAVTSPLPISSCCVFESLDSFDALDLRDCLLWRDLASSGRYLTARCIYRLLGLLANLPDEE